MNDTHTISDLDKLSLGFIYGEIEIIEINKLDLFNRFYVLSLSAIWSLTRIGMMSAKSCASSHLALLNEYKTFTTGTYFQEKSHFDWIERRTKVSAKLTELAKAIKNKEPNAFELSLSIIDLLTGEDVYLKLFRAVEADEDFKQNCWQAVRTHEFELEDKFGNIPYYDLMCSFYKCTQKTNAVNIYKELDADNLNKVARHVPLKSDDIKGICESYKKLLNIK